MNKFKSSFLVIFFLIFSFNFELYAKAYLKADVIDATLLNPPFTQDSMEWKNEIKKIVKLQKNPDQKEIEEAKLERDLKPEMIALFADKNLSREDNPKLYALLDNTLLTADLISSNAKKYWKTTRPYLASKNVKSLILLPNISPAYPSGHTTESYVLAHILGQIFPQKRNEFIKRANEIANHRVLIGMHYPKDLEGGRELALLIVGALMNDAEFLEDLEEVKGEMVS